MVNPLLPAEFWGLSIGIYLFLGGLAGGAYVAGAVADLLSTRQPERQDSYFATARWSMVIAVGAIAVGGLLLVSHLGEPLNVLQFWLFTNSQSWMTIGIWVIVLFTLLAMVQALWLGFGRENGFAVSIGPIDTLARITRPSERVRRGITAFGIAVGVLLAVYTALLISATGDVVPLWDPTWLPLLFLTSSLSIGIAAVFGLTTLTQGVIETGVEKFSLADDVIILAEMGVLAILLVTLQNGNSTAVETVQYIMQDGWLLFWGGVVGVGLVAPLVLSAALILVERRVDLHGNAKTLRRVRGAYVLKFGLVVVGGLLLRLTIIFGALNVPIIGA
ncbi:NrfD/PsrC family molybdoenzyme membrane anchor subunit [Halodesulfurarchaeum sp. HSR-GB]|uniref:NrfD/PsrC family molybdoenzyme membrane anchor subunit n=1 Tax=Halodesulfurarchaeum sp. HSR-GB TaxID=3074077 RepID=UPI00285FBDCF|nr:NrfD/PsrC family molybdoenzyme membrane anchor subunit [Halodesulfurarchaeum sp. HSR-GB]MDR5656668.1 NrfD/PsrC family molybdoenzyme membrane anchor subunit [Halodesulfurarchaeum sp. HSR-GB]